MVVRRVVRPEADSDPKSHYFLFHGGISDLKDH